MGLRLTKAPEVEPVTIDDVAAQVRWTIDGDQVALVNAYIAAIRGKAETILRRAIITQEWELTLDAFPCREIEIPLPPLQEVTDITYLDTDGAEQTLDESVYGVDLSRGRVYLKAGQSWPSTLNQPSAVTVAFKAGYGDSGDDVPKQIIAWMLLNIGALWENRESMISGPRAQMVELTTLADSLIEGIRVLRV